MLQNQIMERGVMAKAETENAQQLPVPKRGGVGLGDPTWCLDYPHFDKAGSG